VARTGTQGRVASGRHRAGETPAVPAVRDMRGGTRAYEVSFEVRTAYDFLISASLGDPTEHDLPVEERAWLDAARATLSVKDRDALDTCFGQDVPSVFHGLASLIVADAGVQTAADVLAALDTAGPRGVALAVIGDAATTGTPAALVARAVDGDAGALAELEPSLAEWQRDSIREFLANLGSSIARMRGGLDAWLVPFGQVEARIARLQVADLSARDDARASLDPETLIERTTGGLRFMPEPQIRRVILAPSYFGRPYNIVYQGSDWRLFCYPMADDVIEAADGVRPPPSMIRLFRALGDPTRMRVLKLLVGRDWYLTELATQLELSKPTMKHHLALLRAAGLVTVTEEGTLTYYSLRRERLDEAGLELHRYLV